MKARFPQVTQIKSLNERVRRIPRAGVIRLGRKIEVRDRDSGEIKGSRPIECSHFVIDQLPEVRRAYGDQPVELPIMIPNVDAEQFLRIRYEAYKAGGRKVCTGDGIQGYRHTPEGIKTLPCCDVNAENACAWLAEKKCRRVGTFSFMLPECSIAGCYQLSMGGYTYLGDLMDSLAWVNDLVGRVTMVPLILFREEIKTTYEDNRGDVRTSTHYTVKVRPAFSLADLIAQRRRAQELVYANRGTIALPEPVDTDPSLDPPDLVEYEDTGELVDARTGEIIEDANKSMPDNQQPVPVERPAPVLEPVPDQPVVTEKRGGKAKTGKKVTTEQPKQEKGVLSPMPMPRNRALADFGRFCEAFGVTQAPALIDTAERILKRKITTSADIADDEALVLRAHAKISADMLAEVMYAIQQQGDHAETIVAELDKRMPGWRTDPKDQNRITAALDFVNQGPWAK